MITQLSSAVLEALNSDVDEAVTIAQGIDACDLGLVLFQTVAVANAELVPVRRLTALYFAQVLLGRAESISAECATAAILALEPFLRSEVPHERQTVSIIAGLISRRFERFPLDLDESAWKLLPRLRSLRESLATASR
jgi:hypothetical protein